jgi:N-acetylglutamate synthase
MTCTSTFTSTSTNDHHPRLINMQTETVNFIEERAANAWPAAIVQVMDGWRLRYNWGVTSRANSVYPNGWGSALTLDEKLRSADEFYARRGARTLYQISPAAQPAELDAVLEARGYTAASLTNVQNASVEAVMKAAERNPAFGADASRSAGRKRVCESPEVSITPGLTDEWLAIYREAAELSDHQHAMRQGIMQRIGPPAGFALARLDGQPAAVGMAVAERGWAGIFCMETLPAFRRRGAATAILSELARWAQSQGAADLYLQVVANNTPALNLYANAGFRTLYQYHYREAPPQQQAL